MVHVLGDHSSATNLVGISGQVMTYTHNLTQSQNISESSQGLLSHNSVEIVQNIGLGGKTRIQSSDMDVLLPLTFTQEESDGFAGAKDIGSLKAFLLKLGLNLCEGGVFLNRLINLLEQKGIPSHKLSEIREMLVEWNVELLKVDKTITVEGQSQCGIKDLLLQLGVSPEEVEGMSAKDKIAINRLSDILAKLGMSPKKAEEMLLHGLKQALIKAGFNPEEANKLLELGGQQGKSISLKELIGLLNRNVEGLSEGDIAHLSEKEGPSLGDKSTSHHGQGEAELTSRGHIESGTIVTREGEGGKAQVDFEQVMSKMGTREPTSQKVMEQVVKGAKIQVESGQTRAKIYLQPPTLGKLHMYIITKENQVRATFVTETPQVKEIIESNLPQLRQSFLQQGLKLEHFNVFVGYQPSGNQTEQHSLFDAVKSNRLDREGLDGEDSFTIDETIKGVRGNHIVDLFI